MTKKETGTEERLDNLRMFMEKSRGGAAKSGSPEEQRAQDMFYDAMETGDMDLIFKALEIDPGNVDCLLQLLSVYDTTDPEGLDFARQVVETAEKRLGKKAFEEFKGEFWGFLETRPYMRARCDLAVRLVKLGRIDEAIKEHEGMLELCPNDNLGMRMGLLGLYLQQRRLEDAARLLEEYKEERPYNAVLAWGHVLERFLGGALDEAVKTLEVARDVNGYVEAYLKGHRKLPKESAGYYSPGSREEAQICAELQKTAWDANPEALDWLNMQAKGKK